MRDCEGLRVTKLCVLERLDETAGRLRARPDPEGPMRHVGRGVREQIREGRRPRHDNGMQFLVADKIRRDVDGECLRGQL